MLLLLQPRVSGFTSYNITAGVNARYVRFTLTNTICVQIDAVSYSNVSCGGGGGSILNCTYRDEFSSVSYSNSNGTQDWSSNPWMEFNDGSNGPNGNSTCNQTDYVIYVAQSGDCTYSTCPNGNNCLTFNTIGVGNGDYISRQFDLTGATTAIFNL